MSDTTPTPVAEPTPAAPTVPDWQTVVHELEPVLVANKDKIPPKARKVFYEVVGDINAVATGVLAIAPFLPADARWVAIATGVCTFVCKFASAHVPTA